MNFAFPNVNPDFIGCGRYAATDHAAVPAGYAEPQSAIIKREQVEEAAAILAPPPQAVEKRVYERKDRPEQPYAGSSLQLAYLLACISRYRAVKLSDAHGDIWCTGRISISADRDVRLEPVGAKGFQKKLDAFLAPDNADRIFLVSMKNITPSHAATCRAHHARLVPFTNFQAELSKTGHGEKLVVTLLPDDVFGLISVLFALGPNPYKGLSHFEPQDAPLFFGRRELTQQILERYRAFHAADCREPRFLAIMGPSGSGKSSVIRAGFIPQLQRESPAPRVLLWKPGAAPWQALAQALDAQSDALSDAWNGPEAFVRAIREHPDRLGRRLADLIPTPILLILDQFEDLYTAGENADTAAQQRERQNVVDSLLHAASRPDLLIAVLVLLRTDFLGHTRQHPDLDNAIARSNIMVPAMQRAHLRQVIAEPARRAGYALDTETIDQLLADSSGREGALPLLEFALTRIWEGITQGIPPQDTLRAIHGVGGALADRAQQVYDALPTNEQRIARRVFLKLVTLGDSPQEYTTRRVMAADFVAHTDDPAHVNRVLRKFSQTEARLLTLTADNAGRQMVEVAHAALFRYWGTLSGWLDTEHADQRIAERLTQAAIHWKQHRRSANLLWRRPDLDTLRAYYRQHYEDMTQLQLRFFRASTRWHYLRQGAKAGAVALLVVLTIVSRIGWFRATQAAAELERQRNTIIKNLTMSARQLMNLHDELDALVTVMNAVQSVRQAATVEEPLRAFVEETFRGIAGHVLEKNRLQRHTSPVAALSFSHDGKLLASGSSDGTIVIWNPDDGRIVTTIAAGPFAAVGALAFHPERALLASGHLDQTVRLWDSERGALRQEFGGHAGAVRSVTFSPDGRLLASAGDDGVILIRAAESGDVLQRLRGHAGSVYDIEFSPDGRLLASAGKDGTVRLWQMPDGAEFRVLRDHEGFVYSVAFSPDGKLLISGGQDKKIRLWNLTQSTPLTTFEAPAGKEHSDAIYQVAFHPNGQEIASASLDRKILFWSVTDGQYRRTLYGHADNVYQIAFHPDGVILASAGGDRIVKLWQAGRALSSDLSIDDLMRSSCERIHGYLQTNPDVEPDDRHLCDGVLRREPGGDS